MPLNQDQIQEILRRLDSGESQKTISQSMGISRNAINMHRKKHHADARGASYYGLLASTVDRYKVMAARYDGGYSTTEVAVEFGVCLSTVRKAVQKFGTRIPRKQRGKPMQNLGQDPRFFNRQFDYTVIRRYRLRHGLSMAQLAAKIGVAERTVTTWEYGQNMPSIEGILKLQILFGLAPQDFLVEKPEDKPNA